MLPLSVLRSESVGILNQKNKSTQASVECFNTRNIFIPRYKCEDRAAAILAEEGITDFSGEVDRYLANISQIPLNEEERQRVEAHLNLFFDVMGSWEFLKINTSSRQILTELFGNNETIFDDIEIVGSAAFQALGASFCKRFMEHLLGLALADQLDRIPQIIERLFTPEFVDYLNKRLNKKLADIDMRLLANNTPVEALKIGNVHKGINAIIKILIEKLPPLDENKDRERRIKTLELLKNHLPGLDWEWVNINSPYYYEIVIRNLAFNKLAISSKEGELLGIANLGNLSETTIDFVFALKLQRKEIFPGVRIPCRSLLDPSTQHMHVYPTGENWVQAVVDKMCGRVRPNTNTATEDDLKMLICSKTNGQINPVEGSEKILIEIVRRESLNQKNKTVKKVIKAHPQTKNDLTKVFPYFLAQLLKDAINTHLNKDPLAAIAITINAVEILQGELTTPEMGIFLEEMEKTWSNHSSNHLLNLLASILNEKHLLETSNAIVQKIPLIKLCAFLLCQAPNENNGKITVFPRQNAGQPCVEVVLAGEMRSYSLFLNIGNTSELLRDAIKFVKLPRTNAGQENLSLLMKAFHTTFRGPWSSPMLDDMRFLDHNSESFEIAATSNLLHTEVFLGTHIYFATQTLVGNVLPLDSMIVNLPSIVCRMRGSLSFLFDNLSILIKTEQQQRLVQQFRTFLEKVDDFTEIDAAKKWISLMSLSTEWIPLAFQCFVESIHPRNDSAEIRTKLILELFDRAAINVPHLTLRILQFIQQKEYVSFKELSELFTTATDITLRNFGTPSFAVEVHRLEKIAKESMRFKTDEDKVLFRKMIAPLFPHSKMLQMMEERFVRFDVQVSLSESNENRTTTKEQRLAYLTELAETDYEEAAEELMQLKGVLYELPSKPIFDILYRILDGCWLNDNHPLALSILKNVDLHEYFSIRPEKYFVILLRFIENCGMKNLWNLQEMALGMIFKSFKPGELIIPTPSKITLELLVTIALKILNQSAFIDNDFLKRRFSFAFASLDSCLHAKDLYMQRLEIYHAAYTLGDMTNVQKSATSVLEVLPLLMNDTEHLPKMIPLIDQILPALSNYATDSSKKNLAGLLKCLVSQNKFPEKVRFYLEQLLSIEALNTPEHLKWLFEQYKKFKRAHINEALCFLENYTGPKLSPTDIPEANQYLNNIEALTKSKDWKHACKAIAINPFVWSDPKQHNRLSSYAQQTVNEILKIETLSLQELKWVFSILNRDCFTFKSNLIISCIERCDNLLDSSLATLVWKVFVGKFVSYDQKNEIHKAFLIMLSTLKLLDKDLLQTLLDNFEMLRFVARSIPNDAHPGIFRSFVKANIHLIKNAKACDKLRLLKQFEKRVNKWLDIFQLPLPLVKNNPLFDVIDYYMSNNENDMIPEAASLLSIISGNSKIPPKIIPPKEAQEHLARTLGRCLNRISKDSTPHISDAVLISILVDGISLEIPFMILGRCLTKCHSRSLVKTGLDVVRYCASRSTFTPQEIVQLHSLKVGEFIRYCLTLISNQELRCQLMVIFSEKKLALFMSKEEFLEIQALLCKEVYAHGVKIANDSQERNLGPFLEALLYLTPHIANLHNQDNQTYDDYCCSFVDLFLDETNRFEPVIKSILDFMVKENGLDQLCLLAEGISRPLIAWSRQEHDAVKLQGLLQQFSRAIISVREKMHTLSKKQLGGLKKVGQILLCFNSKPISFATQEFVRNLKLESYPLDLLEMQIALMIVQRLNIDECLNQCRQYADQSCEIAKSVIFEHRDLSLEFQPQRVHENCKFALECFELFPNFEELHALVLSLCFTTLGTFPDHEGALNKLMPLWLRAIERQPQILEKTLEIYIDNVPSQSIAWFRKKLFGLLEYMTIDEIKMQDRFCGKVFGRAFQHFFEKLMNNLLDSRFAANDLARQCAKFAPNSVFRKYVAESFDQYQGHEREPSIKEIFELFHDFYQHTIKYYHRPLDIKIAGDCYAFMLTNLAARFKYTCIIQDKKFLLKILNDFDYIILQAKGCPMEHREVYTLLENAKQKIEKEFKEIMRKHKKHLK